MQTKRNLLLQLAALGIATTFAGMNRATAQTALDAGALRTNALQFLARLPEKVPGSETDTPALVSLGRKLYFEKRLSQNGGQSCNSCHVIDGGGAGVDHQPTSPGAFGKRGDRNSPTTYNAALHMAQFWDGRAPDLKEQAKGPILNPVEMAMTSAPEVIERLSADQAYPQQFKAAFPDDGKPINYENVAKAIAAFERTLITHDRFDDFLAGQDDALSGAELRGLKTFMEAGCTTCHNGPLLGGNSYQKVGLVFPYANQKDVGRSAITKDEDDKFKFKVPSLRNIGATNPYFHDGKVSTLHDAVRTMAKLQLGLDLTGGQESDLVAFLKSLTGKQIKTTASAR